MNCLYQTPIRLFSIDPGSNHVGFAMSEISSDFKSITVVDATTVNLPKLLNRNEQPRAKLFGDKVAKLHILRHAVTRYAEAWNPLCVVSETPYMGKFPQAYGALMECYFSIRLGLSDYNRSMILHGIDPSSVKASVGVNGRSDDKELVRKALLKLPDLILDVQLLHLDEHAIDAIAVAYSYYKSNVRVL